MASLRPPGQKRPPCINGPLTGVGENNQDIGSVFCFCVCVLQTQSCEQNYCSMFIMHVCPSTTETYKGITYHVYNMFRNGIW